MLVADRCWQSLDALKAGIASIILTPEQWPLAFAIKALIPPKYHAEFDFMLSSLAHCDFYILCPDNDVQRALDEKRMAWAMGDIIENRPPLSRWHKDYGAAFADYLKR